MKLFDAEAMGRRITRRRQKLGLTQKELAESIGLSISFYGHIERGTRVPSVPTLALIANRLSVGVDSRCGTALDVPCLPKWTFTDRELGLFRQFMESQGQSADKWFNPKDE